MKWPIIIGCVLVLLSADHAWAQAETENAQTEKGAASSSIGRGLKVPIIIWSAGVAADQITTYRFSSRYSDLLHETNVITQGLDRSPALLVAAGTALDATTGWLLYRLVGRQHPRLATVVFYGAAVYRSYLAVHNIQMMHRAELMRVAGAMSEVPSR
jgi:hypothetical protein